MTHKNVFICRCKDVQIGSYGNQLWVHPPSHMPKDNGYCLDRCIAEEVMQLWMKGITTTGCCCGHGNATQFIGVVDSDIEKMKGLGYVVAPNTSRPGDEDSFYPKGIPNMVIQRRCGECNAPRKGARCWKCDSETFIPAETFQSVQGENRMNSVKIDGLPEADTPVLVYFDNPEIAPEIDYVDVCPEHGNEFFANCGDDVVYWAEIPKHPSKQR